MFFLFLIYFLFFLFIIFFIYKKIYKYLFKNIRLLILLIFLTYTIDTIFYSILFDIFTETNQEFLITKIFNFFIDSANCSPGDQALPKKTRDSLSTEEKLLGKLPPEKYLICDPNLQEALRKSMNFGMTFSNFTTKSFVRSKCTKRRCK